MLDFRYLQRLKVHVVIDGEGRGKDAVDLFPRLDKFRVPRRHLGDPRLHMETDRFFFQAIAFARISSNRRSPGSLGYM